MALRATLNIAKRFYSSGPALVQSKKYVLKNQFKGEPKFSDFDIVIEDLPALKNNEILVQAEYLSVDPYMRAYMVRYQLPADMIGTQVGRIIESKNDKFPVGKRLAGQFGWRSHTVADPSDTTQTQGIPLAVLPDLGGLSPSLALGVLGMPGNTAYFGFLEICKPKAGETVVVTGAAGAVGSHVGQLAKIKGCKVIGFAGSDSKCKWLKEELGFDYAFNYKTVNASNALKEAAPQGIDCYFDNVGGELSSIIMNQMNTFGRVSVCGSISSYNDDISALPRVPIIQPTIVFKELSIEGFIVSSKFGKRWTEGIQQNLQLIKEGKLKYREHVTEGFDNMYEAFVGMLRGDNTGKAIIKV